MFEANPITRLISGALSVVSLITVVLNVFELTQIEPSYNDPSDNLVMRSNIIVVACFVPILVIAAGSFTAMCCSEGNPLLRMVLSLGISIAYLYGTSTMLAEYGANPGEDFLYMVLQEFAHKAYLPTLVFTLITGCICLINPFFLVGRTISGDSHGIHDD
ncbi:hypothetical protein CFO_g5588 [Ceratocystis platani]|uniref:Uncharacterized protein n=1 Tax=Ceratocystis fimbriata f. sp. platani TaxID=88771 RepID=A0A0F8AZ25_CERFI|nr:hypothetical protein CFO_g5588 [Ceratocystis platani]